MNGDRVDAKAEIDRLTASFFGLFSNCSEAPDLRRIFDLFVSQGLIAKCTGIEPEVSTVQEFITPRQELLTNGRLTDFAELEVSESTHIFGNVAQRVSMYRKSGCLDGIRFSTRGMKSFQFLKTGGGWRILSMAWDDERESFSIHELS